MCRALHLTKIGYDGTQKENTNVNCLFTMIIYSYYSTFNEMSKMWIYSKRRFYIDSFFNFSDVCRALHIDKRLISKNIKNKIKNYTIN